MSTPRQWVTCPRCGERVPLVPKTNRVSPHPIPWRTGPKHLRTCPGSNAPFSETEEGES